MRLDHLLSKEHLAPRVIRWRPGPLLDVHASVGLMGGTLTSSVAASSASSSTAGGSFGVRVVGTGGGGGVVVGTLLGPEGADASSDHSSAVRRLPRPWLFAGVGLGVRGDDGGWDCPYLENCTVDASIFVAKLLRAHGGCLGTRSR